VLRHAITVATASAALVLVSGAASAERRTFGLDPHRFAPHVTNPWFPLTPGSRYVYRGTKDGKQGRDVVDVTHTTKTILGIHATAVSDRLYLAGRLEERTTDWYAQDRAGNVWYLGENTAELDRRGRVTSTEGTWRAGVHGAKPGIYMPAHPAVGVTGRQEYLKGHAEDHFRVLSLAQTVRVPYIRSSHALLTKEWTPLEPGTIDHKYYVRGIGTVKELTVRGARESNVLVSFRR
jgi:hypothetical protein